MYFVSKSWRAKLTQIRKKYVKEKAWKEDEQSYALITCISKPFFTRLQKKVTQKFCTFLHTRKQIPRYQNKVMTEGKWIQVQQSGQGSFFFLSYFLPIYLCCDLPRNKDKECRLGNELVIINPVLPLKNGLCRWVTSISWHNFQGWDWKFKSEQMLFKLNSCYCKNKMGKTRYEW